MTRLRVTAATTFRSLRVRNYRLYFTGQLISVSGTWMQGVAQAWLVVRQPHGLAPPSRAGVDLGIVTALQFLPMLLFGTWGGLIADRFDKRHVLYGTQAAAGVLALALGLLTSTGTVRLWHVELLATLLGFVNLVDNPARQTFVLEMVGPDDLPNAVGLNSVLMNASRIIGPALGGVLIATVGLAPCFEVNAASYVAVVPMGAASLPFIATANSTLQLNAEQTMRGRVMALYAMAFLGTTPIGSLLVGWISQVASPRVALLLGGVATVVASLATRARHHRTRQVPVEVVGALDEQHPGSTLGVA